MFTEKFKLIQLNSTSLLSFLRGNSLAKAVTSRAQSKEFGLFEVFKFFGFLCRYVAAFLLFIIKIKKKEKKNEPKRNQPVVSKAENTHLNVIFIPPSRSIRFQIIHFRSKKMRVIGQSYADILVREVKSEGVSRYQRQVIYL